MPVKLTTEEFIKRAKSVHGNAYDCSMVKYTTTQNKVKIICFEHGEFEIPACKFLKGRGCPVCSGKTLTTEEFVKRAKNVHGDTYDYSKVKYNGAHKKIKIICSLHGEFEQTPDRHLYGGCNKCAREEWGIKKTLTTDDFIERANSIHEFRYNYSLVNYNHGHEKVKIICPEHGEFEQMPINHLSGKGCLICNISKGEKIIRKWLLENKVKFVSQKKFKDCRNNLPLPFDFYLPEHNACIEFDGRQHFESIKHFGGDDGFKKRLINDNLKNEFCKKNKIDLYRIKYNDDINLKLKEFKII